MILLVLHCCMVLLIKFILRSCKPIGFVLSPPVSWGSLNFVPPGPRQIASLELGHWIRDIGVNHWFHAERRSPGFQDHDPFDPGSGSTSCSRWLQLQVQQVTLAVCGTKHSTKTLKTMSISELDSWVKDTTCNLSTSWMCLATRLQVVPSGFCTAIIEQTQNRKRGSEANCFFLLRPSAEKETANAETKPKQGRNPSGGGWQCIGGAARAHNSAELRLDGVFWYKIVLAFSDNYAVSTSVL